MGSFVPADSQDGIVDKIFTRVGASDNISMGRNEWNSLFWIIFQTESGLVGRNRTVLVPMTEFLLPRIAEFLHEHPQLLKRCLQRITMS
jgi:DNA mismatch repair protein MutS